MISMHTYNSLNSILTNSIESGLIDLCKWSIGKLNKLNLNPFIEFDRFYKNSWKLTQMLMLKKKTLEIYNCQYARASSRYILAVTCTNNTFTALLYNGLCTRNMFMALQVVVKLVIFEYKNIFYRGTGWVNQHCIQIDSDKFSNWQSLLGDRHV